ncbi:MAG: hypothetical protein O3B73_06660 [bacterium]|jgi:hypothetical protein|nr:hypothetical protein [bacterium]
MNRALIASIVLISFLGCSRNGEYRYISHMTLVEPAGSLLPKITQRLRASEFRKNYDLTLVDRIGSSFTNFKHIRAYQAVLEDALVYLMIKAKLTHLDDGLRNSLIHPVSKLILSHRSGDQFIEGLDKMAQMISGKQPASVAEALRDYDALLKAEGD